MKKSNQYLKDRESLLQEIQSSEAEQIFGGASGHYNCPNKINYKTRNEAKKHCEKYIQRFLYCEVKPGCDGHFRGWGCMDKYY